MPLEITLTGNNKVRLNPQYPVIAGVDENMVPRLLRVDEDGFLAINVTIPPIAGGATEARQIEQITAANETKVLIGAVNETPPASDTADSGLNGRLTRLAQRLTDFIALFPSALGQWNSAGSLSVTIADDQLLDVTAVIGDGDDTTQGAQGDAAASTDTGTFSIVALIKRGLQSLTSLLAITHGPANLVTSQGTASNTATLFVIARPTRRSVIIRNASHGEDIIWVGPISVSTSNGMPINPGEAMSFSTTAAIYRICEVGVTPPWAVADEYD